MHKRVSLKTRLNIAVSYSLVMSIFATAVSMWWLTCGAKKSGSNILHFHLSLSEAVPMFKYETPVAGLFASVYGLWFMSSVLAIFGLVKDYPWFLTPWYHLAWITMLSDFVCLFLKWALWSEGHATGIQLADPTRMAALICFLIVALVSLPCNICVLYSLKNYNDLAKETGKPELNPDVGVKQSDEAILLQYEHPIATVS